MSSIAFILFWYSLEIVSLAVDARVDEIVASKWIDVSIITAVSSKKAHTIVVAILVDSIESFHLYLLF